MDSSDLATYVNSTVGDPFVSQCWDQAMEMVNKYVGTADVSLLILDRCYLECASELFHARNAPNGIAQYNDMTGAPVRIARDPMTRVYSLLSPWIPMGIPRWSV